MIWTMVKIALNFVLMHKQISMNMLLIVSPLFFLTGS